MAAITGHYNVTVNSKYYVFLEDGMESAELGDLMATAEKNRELRKENKTKAKKEKRNKQIAEAIKEVIKVESKEEENVKVEVDLVKSKEETIEMTVEIQEFVNEDKNIENKTEKRGRGRGNTRRSTGGPRRGGYTRNEEPIFNNDETCQPKSQDGGYSRFPNTRRRPFRKDRPSEDSYNKVEYFEDQSASVARGNSSGRRPSGRGSGRYSRGNDRNSNERNDRYSNDRNSNERNDRYSNDRNNDDRYSSERNTSERFSNNRSTYERGVGYNKRNFTDKLDNENGENFIDIIPENMGTFEDMSDRPMKTTSRGRYPRNNRGSYNRYSTTPSNTENDVKPNRMGYFNENSENREYSRGGSARGGGGGRSRGGRARGRSDFWRPKNNDREESLDENNMFSPNVKNENRDVPVVEKWPDVDEEEPGSEVVTVANNEPLVYNTENIAEKEFNDVKKSNWGEIEDDPIVEEKKTTNENMTLEEWKLQHHHRSMMNQEAKEYRKANDGKDVFNGMEVYRKNIMADEQQGFEHEMAAGLHENQHGRQRQSIPVEIRFSRNTDYGLDSNNYEQTSTVESRNFSTGSGNTGGGSGGGGHRGGTVSGGAGGGSRGDGYFMKNENRFRGDNSTSGFGGGGRSRGGGGGGSSDFNSYGRGRDFNRGRGKFHRNNQYSVKRKEDQIDDVNINLGNEDEFPTLSLS